MIYIHGKHTEIVIALHTYLGRFHTHTHTHTEYRIAATHYRYIIIIIICMFTRDRFRL